MAVLKRTDIGNMETPIYYLKFVLKSLFLAVLKRTNIGIMETPIYYLKFFLKSLNGKLFFRYGESVLRAKKESFFVVIFDFAMKIIISDRYKGWNER